MQKALELCYLGRRSCLSSAVYLPSAAKTAEYRIDLDVRQSSVSLFVGALQPFKRFV